MAPYRPDRMPDGLRNTASPPLRRHKHHPFTCLLRGTNVIECSITRRRRYPRLDRVIQLLQNKRICYNTQLHATSVCLGPPHRSQQRQSIQILAPALCHFPGIFPITESPTEATCALEADNDHTSRVSCRSLCAVSLTTALAAALCNACE